MLFERATLCISLFSAIWGPVTLGLLSWGVYLQVADPENALRSIVGWATVPSLSMLYLQVEFCEWLFDRLCVNEIRRTINALLEDPAQH